MERLVISYYVGSDYDGQHLDVPIEYESAEVFLVHFEEKLDKYIEEKKTFLENYKNKKLNGQMIPIVKYKWVM